MKTLSHKGRITLCAALLITSALVSCTGSGIADDTTDADLDAVDTSQDSAKSICIIDTDAACRLSDDAVAALPDIDLSNDNVIIATSDRITVLSDDTESIVNRKRYERLNMLEERFNFKFVKRLATDSKLYTEARTAHRSGLYFADMLCISPESLWRYGTGDASMLASIAALPFVDLDAPYYNADAIDAASADGIVYAAFGSSNMNVDELTGVFFNKNISSEYDLYDDVYENNWTIERMLTLSRSTAYDSDGKKTGVRSLLTDLTTDAFIDNVYFAANGLNISSSPETMPIYTPLDEAAQSCVDLVYELMYNKSGFTRTNDARKLFASDDTLFLVSKLSEKSALADSEFDWGILPLPAYESGGEYRTLANDGVTVTAVLSSTPDLTRSGILLEGINAAMYGYVDNAYSDECAYEIVRDNDTLNMIDIIKDSACVSFAHMFSGGIDRLDDCTYLAVRGTVKTKNTLEDYNKKGTKLSDELNKAFAN